MASKEVIYIVVAAIVLVVVYQIYKKMLAAKDIAAKAYNSAVDGTADVIADITGLNKQVEENAKPIDRNTPGFTALTQVVAAYRANTKVSESIWETAYSEYPNYGTVLRAGKKWGYGSFWNYFGKEF